MSAVQWSSVDDDTADLLTLVADKGHVSADYEWLVFVQAMDAATGVGGRVSPNAMRENLRDRVAPKRIGAFYRRALVEGLLVTTGDWEISDDVVGHNAGRPVRVYRRVWDA